MLGDWYPNNKKELNQVLDEFLLKELIKHHKTQDVHGIIVPHAGYTYSGKIAGKAYAAIKGAKKAMILSPNHYFPLNGVVSDNREFWETPLGKVRILDNNFRKARLSEEHAIDNQIPFLQKLGIEEIIPLIVGEVTSEKALEIAEKIKDFNGIFIISSDLSHFHPYDEAKIIDQNTIKIIQSLNLDKAQKIDACGIYPLMVFMHLAKIKGWKPELIEYKNSGDITNDKSKVVGYASFKF